MRPSALVMASLLFAGCAPGSADVALTPTPDLAATVESILSVQMSDQGTSTETSELGAASSFSFARPTPTPTSTPIPGRVIARTAVRDTGQRGNTQEGEFEIEFVPASTSARTLILSLWVPERLSDGNDQTLVRMAHSAFSGIFNYINVPTVDGPVRLYLLPDGMLSLTPITDELEGRDESIQPGGPAFNHSIVLEFDLSPGQVTYAFRLANAGLSPMLVEVRLVLLD